MRYSRRMKESALRKVLPPESRSVSDVSRKMGDYIVKSQKDSQKSKVESHK